jgi:hypothetical protein
MASPYENKLVVLEDGKLKKIGAGDTVKIGGTFEAGHLKGDGADITGLTQGQISGLETALSTLTSDVGAAQGDATQALSDAAGALSAAQSAQGTADQAVIDAAAAQADADSAQTDATQALGDAATADGKAVAAQGDATQALADAATADGKAVAAQADATQALSDAAGALSAAQAAQGDATQALSDAAGALSAAQAAQADATDALDAVNAATDLNTASTIVKRDANGDFSAGIISASLDGNASTANQWASSVNVEFAGGDVTGNFDIDGSGNVTNVGLAIGSGVVTNTMLAGSISDDKLDQITSTGKVADSALSSNVAFLDAGTAAFTGDMTIGGSLTVTGPIISAGEINSTISDAFIDLATGNVGTAAKAGGLTVNLKKATGFAVETAITFVAGVASVSDPVITMSASSALVLGDIVQVSGSDAGLNDGLYVVYNKVGSAVTLKGIGLHAVASYVPFCHNQVTAQSGQAASVVKVDLAVFAVSNGLLSDSAGYIDAGKFCYNYVAGATEGAFSGSWTAVNTEIQSLQSVYGKGNEITLVDTKPFKVIKPTSGTAGIELEGKGASYLKTDTGGLVIEAVASGDVELKVASGAVIKASGQVMLGDSVGFIGSVAAGVGDFELLYVDTDGVAKKISSGMEQTLDCVSLEANSGGAAADKKVGSVLGSKIYVTVTGGAAIGDVLYVSATEGQATKTVPTAGRLIKVGKVVGAASGSHYPVIFAPQYIADL